MKNLIKILFVLSFLLSGSVKAQTIWMRYYDYNNWSNSGKQAIQTNDGGFAFYSIASIYEIYQKKSILLTKKIHLA